MSKMAQMKVVGGRQMICFPDGAQFYLMKNARKYAKRKGFSIPKVNPGARWRDIETPEQERKRVMEERRKEAERLRASEEAAQERRMEQLRGKRRHLVRPTGVETLEAGESRQSKRKTDATARALLGRKSGRTRNPRRARLSPKA
jgi:hypothetical protein